MTHKRRYCILDINVPDVTSINPMSDTTSQFLALYFNLLGTPFQARKRSILLFRKQKGSRLH